MPDTSITAGTGAIPAPVKDDHGIWGFSKAQFGALGLMIAFLVISPFFLYPVFLMKLLCFALFACAFNLLIGYVGLLSFGHAAYFGMGGYIAGHVAKAWGMTPELAIITGGLVALPVQLSYVSLGDKADFQSWVERKQGEIVENT